MHAHDVDVVLSPYQGRSHWLTDHGSLAHLVKR
jgi:RNase P/RNase MRP subunit p30